MIRNLAAIILIGAALGFVLYHLYQFSVSINNPKSKLIAHLKKMRASLLNKYDDFVKLELDEFKRLSADVVQSGLLNLGTQFGSIKSIFNENLVNYISETTSIEDVSLLYIKSANLEMGFVKSASRADIYQNGIKVGQISKDYQLKDELGNVSGGILSHDNEHFKLILADHIGCLILKPSHITVPQNARLLSEIDDNLLIGNDLAQGLLFYYIISELS